MATLFELSISFIVSKARSLPFDSLHYPIRYILAEAQQAFLHYPTRTPSEFFLLSSEVGREKHTSKVRHQQEGIQQQSCSNGPILDYLYHRFKSIFRSSDMAPPRLDCDHTSSTYHRHPHIRSPSVSSMAARRRIEHERAEEYATSATANPQQTVIPLGAEDASPLTSTASDNANNSSPSLSLDDVSLSTSSRSYDEDMESRNPLLPSDGMVIFDPHPSRTARRQAVKLAFGAAGIYSCYLLYGHVQEDLFSYETDASSDMTVDRKFRHVWFLQVMECTINVIVGIIGRKVAGGRVKATSTKAMIPFFQSGASQVFAKVLTSLSLAAGLSYPVAVLAKSAKVVPVMIGQLLLGGSKYTLIDYLFASFVVGGTALLSMGGGKAKTNGSFTTPTGLIFIILSLVADGITGGLQKRLKRELKSEGGKQQEPTTYDFLLFTNLAMGIVAFVIAIVVGDLTSGYIFMKGNPEVQSMLMQVCLLSAMGQSFIFYVVANFDPMVCATVTTTRKILSVLWSLTMKDHHLTVQGYVGLVVAIGGICLGLVGKANKKERKKTHAVVSPKRKGKGTNTKTLLLPELPLTALSQKERH